MLSRLLLAAIPGSPVQGKEGPPPNLCCTFIEEANLLGNLDSGSYHQQPQKLVVPKRVGGGIVTDAYKVLLGTAIRGFAFLVCAHGCLWGWLGAGVYTRCTHMQCMYRSEDDFECQSLD